jgi:transketolase
MSTTNIDKLCVDTIRTLCMDAVQAANSGHPGTPMAMAPVVYCLWQRLLNYDPAEPRWANRDRFVLSAGHASTLLYSTLHLAGVKAVEPGHGNPGGLGVELDDLKHFRQLGSRCPGHPEYGFTAGVETTTGPLGNGAATSVGMAIASRWLAARFNQPGFALFDYSVYSLLGDGCMMEGIGAEAASLAGHLKLSNLCWIYDSNRITIEGNTSLAFSEDVATRFFGYGWNVTRVGDANDLPLLEKAFKTFKATTDRPTLIIVDSHIAWGAPNKQDTHGAHGEPLGEEEIKLAKRAYGWPENEKFLVPDGVREHFQQQLGARGAAARAAWNTVFAAYKKAHPELAASLESLLAGELPAGWESSLPVFAADPKGLATRESSGQVLNEVAKSVPWLIGGSADLAPSTKTRLTFKEAGDFASGNCGGRNLHFGVREHAMAAIVNGLTLSGLKAYGSGFMVFSDYARGAIRLSALMEIPAIHIFTHDSINVGEDGPTHQPVEHLAALRAIPHLLVIRPADANEVSEAWRVILRLKHQPVALILSRQALPTLDRTHYAPASGLAQGAYVLAEAPGGKPAVLLIGTGSEVPLCLEAYERLKAEGIPARVISMPSWELFERQPKAYQDSVLPPEAQARVAVEAGSPMGWHKYARCCGEVIAMNGFGASAPMKELRKKFGFTVERVIEAAKRQLAAH